MDVAAGQIIYPTCDFGVSGLTPGIQVTDKATGATLLARTTSGIVEQPAGLGSYDYTAGFTVPDGVSAFKVAWNNNDGDVVGTEDYEVVGTAASVVALLSGSVSLVVPVAVDGDVTLIRGDDYNASDGRALDWSTTDSATWPDLTGATIALAAALGSHRITKTGSVVTPSGANKKVRVQLASADTASVPIGLWSFDIQATLSSGRKVTLVSATLTIRQDYAA